MDYKKIGRFIMKKRKEKGYTQCMLANKLFVDKRIISCWERGISLPDIWTLVKLSQILGVTVSNILFGEDINKNKSSVEELIGLMEINYK